MYCNHCGTKISGRIVQNKNKNLYYCPNKKRSWKSESITKENRYKRYRVDGHGCDMVKSLSIPLHRPLCLDESSRRNFLIFFTQRRGEKPVLDEKFDTDSDTVEIKKKEKAKRAKLCKAN